MCYLTTYVLHYTIYLNIVCYIELQMCYLMNLFNLSHCLY